MLKTNDLLSAIETLRELNKRSERVMRDLTTGVQRSASSLDQQSKERMAVANRSIRDSISFLNEAQRTLTDVVGILSVDEYLHRPRAEGSS